MKTSMRTIICSARQIRSACRCQKENALIELGRKQSYLVATSRGLSYKLSCNDDKCKYTHSTCMISRAFCADAAKVTNGEVGRKGPLIEYERRISAGELVDGDTCQVGTLRELQRLYDELVESASVCCLDRYVTSEKASRSRWLWSRFIPQSSQSPVKWLYLYGGIGTGKTMLMDLFFEQLELPYTDFGRGSNFWTPQ